MRCNMSKMSLLRIKSNRLHSAITRQSLVQLQIRHNSSSPPSASLSSASSTASSSSTSTTTDSDTVSCSCSSPQWPCQFDQPIDHQSPLPALSPYSHHFLINTPNQGAHDWPSLDSAIDPQSSVGKVLESIKKVKELRTGRGKILVNQVTDTLRVTHSSLPEAGEEEEGERCTTIQLFPKGIEVTVQSSSSIPSITAQLTSLLQAPTGPILPTTTIRNLENAQILICAHLQRDSRCGFTAPLLFSKTHELLNKMGLEEQGIEVRYVSHVGGHKFAGNIVIYVPRPSSPIVEQKEEEQEEEEERYGAVWYARVDLDNLGMILEETLGHGRVVKGNVKLRTGQFIEAQTV